MPTRVYTERAARDRAFRIIKRARERRREPAGDASKRSSTAVAINARRSAQKQPSGKECVTAHWHSKTVGQPAGRRSNDSLTIVDERIKARGAAPRSNRERQRPDTSPITIPECSEDYT